MTTEPAHEDLLHFVANIVSAHVSRNSVTPQALPDVIRSVHATLVSVTTDVIEPTKPVPKVPAKKSVFPDYIICLEDGIKLKTLKRHLRVSYGLTPQQYRERWGLPHDYPMVAPNYAARRSLLAKGFGLGRKAAALEPPDPLPVRRIAEGVRGRSPGKKAAGRVAQQGDEAA